MADPAATGQAGTSSIPIDCQLDVQIHRRQGTRTPLGPFDQPQAGAALVQAEEIQFASVADAVQIQMPGFIAGSEWIALDQGIGRATNRTGDTECPQQGARQGGFAGAKDAVQLDHRAGWPHRSQRAAQKSDLSIAPMRSKWRR